jgi:hypothetical protein
MDSERRMLLEHGTVISRLKPINILQAALADLKLREKKEIRKADPEALYSFARRHVQRARDAEHLIALAYYDPKAAERTDKQSTLIVYGDRDLLRETLVALLMGDLDALRDAQPREEEAGEVAVTGLA